MNSKNKMDANTNRHIFQDTSIILSFCRMRNESKRKKQHQKNKNEKRERKDRKGGKREREKKRQYIKTNSLSCEDKKTTCILFTEMGYALGLFFFARLSGIAWLCPSGNGEMPVLFGGHCVNNVL